LLWLKNNWKLSAVISAVLLLAIWELSRDRFDDDVIVLETDPAPTLGDDDDAQSEILETVMYVDVKGAVNHPDVYQVNGNERVDDLIELAGGFTEDAAESQLNLAEKVFDEMVIYVPVQDEEQNITPPGNDKVRINVASQEEIESLPGIGPAKALTIIQYIEENGAFQSIDELEQVTGIGAKMVENLVEYVQVP